MLDALPVTNPVVEYSPLVKTITIETSRLPPVEGIPNARFSAIITRFQLSEPLLDYHARLNHRLLVATSMFGDNPNNKYYWAIKLDEHQQNTLESEYFGWLRAPFTDYSLQRLDRWYTDAIQKHNIVVNAIEEIYWDKETKIIPKDFLKRFI